MFPPRCHTFLIPVIVVTLSRPGGYLATFVPSDYQDSIAYVPIRDASSYSNNYSQSCPLVQRPSPYPIPQPCLAQSKTNVIIPSNSPGWNIPHSSTRWRMRGRALAVVQAK